MTVVTDKWLYAMSLEINFSIATEKFSHLKIDRYNYLLAYGRTTVISFTPQAPYESLNGECPQLVSALV